MGYWSDLLFGPEPDPEKRVPVTRTTHATCPDCSVVTARFHCESAGCAWFLCVPCGLVITSGGRTRRWNGPPK